MARKPTYEELEKRFKELKKETLERKRAEEALHESRAELTTILENAPIMMILVDPERRVREANSAVVEFTGRPVEEIIGLRGGEALRCLHSLDDPKGCGFGPSCEGCTVRRVVIDTLETSNNHHRVEISLPFERGGKQEERTFYVSTAFINIPKKQWVLVCIEDITEQRKAEQALRKAHDELERQVEERTAEVRFLSGQLLKAHEEERRIIALDLHDSLGQILSGIKFKVESALEKKGQENSADLLKSLVAVVPMVQEAVEEVRRIQQNLRPSVLDDLGILPTVSWFCRDFETIYSGIRIEKEIQIQEDDVPDFLKIVIYRILQEALNNVAKHSRANLVRVSLKGTDGRVELSIDDNGKGFPVEHVLPGKGSKGGLGLTSMKERTELSGGSFTIESHKGGGTSIRVSWQCENINSTSL